ncbi:MAG: polyprenyl diphosphate synthase [Polyangiaceae bacterium]
MTSSHAARTLPAHVGIIMDGNGRWATQRGLRRSAGHLAGSEALTRTYRACQERGIRQLTVYAFSADNWRRPQEEVSLLMHLFAAYSKAQEADLLARGICLQTFGETDDLPSETRRTLEAVERATSGGTSMKLAVAVNYGARRDVILAARAAACAVQAGILLPEEVNEATLRGFMSTADLPDVDLLIRTGGELRLSDFLLLEAAYAELSFNDVLWPDFAPSHLDSALRSYARRERRFGGVGAQPQLVQLDKAS